MTTKIKYTTAAGKVFHTIAPIEPTEQNVKSFMYDKYNMAGIVGYSFKPSVKTKFKHVVNYCPVS